MRVKKFAIISVPRTGSSVLSQCLNNHPDILMHGEIFHPNVSEHIRPEFLSNLDLNLRNVDPIGFMENIFGIPVVKKAVGFKIFEAHNNFALDVLLKNPKIKKIILKRDNYLAMYSSLLIAESLDYWNDANIVGNLEKTVFFDQKKFLGFYEYYESCFENWIKTIEDNHSQQFLLIRYSPEGSMVSAAREVVKFLDLEVGNSMAPLFKKLNTRNILSRFSNPDEVIDTLTKIGKEEWVVE